MKFLLLSFVFAQTGHSQDLSFSGSREGAKDVEIRLCRKEPGKDWTAPASIAVGIHDGKRGPTRNPVVFETFEGKVLLFYRIFGITKGFYLFGYMKTSTDGGKNWSEPRRIAEDCIGPEKNKPIQLEDGTILSPTADRNGQIGYRVCVEKSTDGGETWVAMPPIKSDMDAIQPAIMIPCYGFILSIMLPFYNNGNVSQIKLAF